MGSRPDRWNPYQPEPELLGIEEARTELCTTTRSSVSCAWPSRDPSPDGSRRRRSTKAARSGLETPGSEHRPSISPPYLLQRTARQRTSRGHLKTRPPDSGAGYPCSWGRDFDGLRPCPDGRHGWAVSPSMRRQTRSRRAET